MEPTSYHHLLSRVDKFNRPLDNLLDAPPLSRTMFEVQHRANLITRPQQLIHIGLSMACTQAEPHPTRNERSGRVADDDNRNRCLTLEHKPGEHGHLRGVEQQQRDDGRVDMTAHHEPEFRQTDREVLGVECQTAETVVPL